MEQFDPYDFHNWLPLRLIEKEGNLLIEWNYCWDIRFDKPFFDETQTVCRMVDSMKGTEQKGKRITSIDFLAEVAQTIEPIPPSLFIFHTSRCGSTLTTQLLSLDIENIVYPEYILVDSILRATINGEMVSVEKRKVWLADLIRIMGQKRFPEEKRLIIKLDSWHFAFFTIIRELYPETPVAILYREPNAIIRSNNNKPGMQFYPEIIPPTLFNLPFPTHFTQNEYADLVLRSLYQSIVKISNTDKKTLLLDYQQEMKPNLEKITRLLAMENSFFERTEVVARMHYHSKEPQRIFREEQTPRETIASEQTLQQYNLLKDDGR